MAHCSAQSTSVVIRLAGSSDAAAVAEIYRPVVESTHISFELVAPDADEMRSRIEHISRSYPWLVATEGDAVLGYAYASRHRERAGYAPSTDVSIYLRDAARGRGIGTALYTALFELLAQRNDLHRAFAGVTLPNDASVALHRKLGFAPVGVYHEAGTKFGRWFDVSWWERPIRA